MLFIQSKWADKYRLVIESDSTNGVKWVKEPNSVPWRFKKWMLQIEAFKRKVSGWQIKHVLREGNKDTDTLAKEGVNREVDPVEFNNDVDA